MDISLISGKLVKYATPGALLIKDSVIWAGRYIQSGFSGTLAPAVLRLWALAAHTGLAAIQCMRASALVSFTIAGTLFAISLTAFKISGSHSCQENLYAKAAWKSIGLAALIASTAATTFSIILITRA